MQSGGSKSDTNKAPKKQKKNIIRKGKKTRTQQKTKATPNKVRRHRDVIIRHNSTETDKIMVRKKKDTDKHIINN